MSFEIFYTTNFEKTLKKLAKKHKSLQNDIDSLLDDLEVNPIQGDSLGKDCYKIRVAITSKARGKSAGARVITCVKIISTQVYLLTIYDKADKNDITDRELEEFLKQIG